MRPFLRLVEFFFPPTSFKSSRSNPSLVFLFCEIMACHLTRTYAHFLLIKRQRSLKISNRLCSFRCALFAPRASLGAFAFKLIFPSIPRSRYTYYSLYTNIYRFTFIICIYLCTIYCTLYNTRYKEYYPIFRIYDCSKFFDWDTKNKSREIHVRLRGNAPNKMRATPLRYYPLSHAAPIVSYLRICNLHREFTRSSRSRTRTPNDKGRRRRGGEILPLTVSGSSLCLPPSLINFHR